MTEEFIKAQDFEECAPDDRPLADNSGYLFTIKYPKELNVLLLGSYNTHRITITFYDLNKGSVKDPKWVTYAYVNGGYQTHHWSFTEGRFSAVELKAVAHELFAEDYRYVQSTFDIRDGRA